MIIKEKEDKIKALKKKIQKQKDKYKDLERDYASLRRENNYLIGLLDVELRFMP